MLYHHCHHHHRYQHLLLPTTASNHTFHSEPASHLTPRTDNLTETHPRHGARTHLLTHTGLACKWECSQLLQDPATCSCTDNSNWRAHELEYQTPWPWRCSFFLTGAHLDASSNHFLSSFSVTFSRQRRCLLHTFNLSIFIIKLFFPIYWYIIHLRKKIMKINILYFSILTFW